MREALRRLALGHALWLYPQGQHRPTHLRPLYLQPGAGWIAQRAGASVVPVAISYGFADVPRPRAYVSFLEALPPGDLDALERALIEGLAHNDAMAALPLAEQAPWLPPKHRLDPFTPIFSAVYRALVGSAP
jgi:1-acyl-sn-glycerol-3-phosphate acyltransferase